MGGLPLKDGIQAEQALDVLENAESGLGGIKPWPTCLRTSRCCTSQANSQTSDTQEAGASANASRLSLLGLGSWLCHDPDGVSVPQAVVFRESGFGFGVYGNYVGLCEPCVYCLG